MRIVLLGSPGTPGEPIERWHDDAYLGALQLGWDVTFLRASTSEPANILTACTGADMLLWMRTHDYNIKGGDGTLMLRQVEDLGVATAGIHFDLYWGVRYRVPRIGIDPWWSAQHVFTADGGDRPWSERGINHHWCPPPFGTRYLGQGKAKNRKQKMAVFVGSNIPSIHSLHRTRLIQWARRQWGYSFEHIGKTPSSRVYGQALNDIYANTKLVLGDSVPSPFYWSDRLPRTLGRGALMAYPKTAGMEQWGFTDDVMITFTPGNFHQIAQKFYAMTPEDQQSKKEAAIQLISDKHLWRHRLEHIAEVVLHGASDYSGGRTSG